MEVNLSVINEDIEADSMADDQIEIDQFIQIK